MATSHRTTTAPPSGLTFQSLKADLFLPAATALIDEVGLGNEALQQVLRHLLLSKESGAGTAASSPTPNSASTSSAGLRGPDLYTGFFATEDLYEVAKNGDPAKGSWVVPVHRATAISQSDFVRFTDEVTGEVKPVIHEAGTFVGFTRRRERQQSASYYTPEVLTRFTRLPGAGGTPRPGRCHHPGGGPAPSDSVRARPGVGAFAIEAVRQLAEQYPPPPGGDRAAHRPGRLPP